MNQPIAPFRILGNLFYVGASDITSYLVTTPQGDILLDGGYVETAPMIRQNVEKLGFHLRDIKILLNSHAHSDHAGGLAQLKKWTGARLLASAGDAPLLERGGKADPVFGDRLTYPPVAVSRLVGDGESVPLGGVEFVAHLTPGHTPGCTTWSVRIKDGETPRNVVFACSASVLDGMRFTEPSSYPGIAADFENSFRTLRSLPCDVFLGSHGRFFHLAEKTKELAAGQRPNPFIDPAGYRAYVDQAEQAFRAELARQTRAPRSR
jgi:metallo-beta-lactamase class B